MSSSVRSSLNGPVHRKDQSSIIAKDRIIYHIPHPGLSRHIGKRVCFAAATALSAGFLFSETVEAFLPQDISEKNITVTSKLVKIFFFIIVCFNALQTAIP